MPLIIPKDLPAYEELQQENVFVMHQERAMSQHIRPLRILSVRSYIAWLSSLTGEEVTVQDSAGNDLLQP